MNYSSPSNTCKTKPMGKQINNKKNISIIVKGTTNNKDCLLVSLSHLVKSFVLVHLINLLLRDNLSISKLKNLQTSLEFFFKSCFLDFMRNAILYTAMNPIRLHTPSIIKKDIYRGELPCLRSIFNVIYSANRKYQV